MRARHTTGDLDAFNARVLACQDQAYTLACYLFDDECTAEQATQAAVQVLYRDGQTLSSLSFSIELYRSLVKSWWRDIQTRRRPAISLGTIDAGERSLHSFLGRLSPGCLLATVLVDCLELGYPEAAYVSGMTVTEIQACLAWSRSSLSAYLPQAV